MSARPFCRLLCALMAACLMLCACAQGAAGAATPEQAAAATPAPTAKPKAEAHSTAHTAAAGETADGVPTVLPESKDAGRSYLDGTLFIGDSNTARYMMYADDAGKAFTTVDNTIGVVSMSASAITTLKCERFKGYSDAYTIPDAVAMLKPRRIIIGFGTNDLSNSSTANYIEKYRQGLAAITAAWEYADIIVCAVPPLDYQRENTRLTMTQVDEFNTALTALCEEEGYHFLNTAEVLKDTSSGWAKKDYTLSDGVHLSKTAVTALFGYIRTHALTTDDRRPKDLGTIPQPDGVPPGLIQQDPIAVRGAKVPVEFVADKGGTLQGATSQNVKKGGTCSAVTAVPNEGWQFDYWTASIGSAGGGASLTFTVPANADANGVIITAHFTPAAHEHDYVEIEGTRIQPTCELGGEVQYECRICGSVSEEELPPSGHQPVTDADSNTVCSVCGKMLQQHVHDFGITVSNTATCGKDGTLTLQCSGCGQTQTQTAKATGKHTYAETVKAATCVDAGSRTLTCSVCGFTTTEAIPATGQHTYGDLVTVTAPTCAAEGSGTRACTVCGATVTEAIPVTSEHTYGDWVTDAEPTCTTEGLRSRTCSVCGAVTTEAIPAQGHDYQQSAHVDPQVGSPGSDTYTCSRCGDSYTTSIDPLPDPAASDPASTAAPTI